jgi:two-component system cell cycle sensor histidine kinase/response regulator CckA
MHASRGRSHRFDWLIVGLVALAGLAVSLGLWRSAQAAEEAQEELALTRQVEARHALIRQTLAGYEESLLAMRIFLTHGREIDQAKFSGVAREQLQRYPGFLGIQWAPRVRAEKRVAWEQAHAGELGGLGRIRERTRDGVDVPALARPDYYPVHLVEPFESNRHVVGSDAAASPLRSVFVAAETSGAVAMSGMLKLVYESGLNDGIVMACPVPAGQGAVAGGYLLGVFRVAHLLAQPWTYAPGRTLDVMFIDESATRSDRRMLYCHRAKSGSGAVSELEFKRTADRRVALAVAGRNWTILYRKGVEPQVFSLGSPIMALVAGLAMTVLGSGLLASNFRRTRSVEREVQLRTAELSESRRQLSALMHSLPGMAFRGTYEDNLCLTFVSEGALGLTGYEPGDFLAGKIHLRDLVHPDDLARVRARTRMALEEKREIEVEYRLRTRAGAETWVLSRGRGVYLAGTPPAFEGLVIDITAQKRAEAARLELERKLLEGQKLESLGLLAGGIAHDFNNLLSTVLGNAELARLTLAPGHEGEGKLRGIESAAVRAADLCRQMLAYAGKGRLVVEPTDLSTLTEDMVPLLNISVARLAGLRLDLPRGIPPVAVDATQIRQIVMNLVLNAADAIAKRGGEISLRTGITSVSPDAMVRCVVGADLPAGDYVFLEVRDDGEGMSPEVLARIFDPFFTTKFAGRGLGLAAVLGIVRGHRGALCVASTPGAGSTFRLFLPPAGQDTLPAAAPATGPKVRWQHAGRVLVVDDEMQVRFVMSEMLRSFGLTPVEAGEGREAITALRNNPTEFELVVLDLLMPGLSGEQTLEALRVINPAVRVLLMSGYSEDDVVRRMGAGGPLRFLAKPFTRANLERELQALLS